MQGQVCSQLVSAKIEREVGSYNDGKRIEYISPGLLSYVCLEECPELESCMASSFAVNLLIGNTLSIPG
jgi:hypothetical protein